MSSVKRMFQSFERLADAGAELTKRDPLPLLVAIVLVLLLAGCSNDPVTNEYIISESAKCEANGFGARITKSGWDSEVTGVQCYQLYEFDPHMNEFTLDDGTRCVSASTRSSTYQAGFSGISCDWNNNADD